MAAIGYSTLNIIPSMKNFGSQLSKGIDPQLVSVGKTSGHSFGKILGLGALAGVGIALGGLGAVIKTGLGEAMDASAGANQLAAGIKSTGNAAHVTVTGINALASSIQGYSGQTDDSIVKSAQLLLTFTNIKNVGVHKIFDQATIASADMAAKMGGSASDSAIMLGKALNDPAKGISLLHRVGVMFTKSQEDSIKAMIKHGDVAGAQSVILKELSVEFGGAAKAAGDSLPGQLAKAKRSFEDVSQSVVEGLIPVVLPALIKVGSIITTTVIPAVNKFVTGFKDGTGAGGTFRDVLDKVGAVLTIVWAGLVTTSGYITGTVIPAIKDFSEWLNDNKEKIAAVAGVITLVLLPALIKMGVQAAISGAETVYLWTLIQASAIKATAVSVAQFVIQGAKWVWLGITSLAAAAQMAAAWVIALGPIAWVIAAIVAVVAVTVANWDTIKNATIAAWNAVSGAVSTAVSAVVDFVKANWPLLLGIITGPIGLAVAEIVKHWDTIKSATSAAWNWVVNFFETVPAKITGALGDLGGLLYDAGKAIISGLWSGMKATWTHVSSWVSGIGSWIADHKGPLDYDFQLLIPHGNAIMDGFNAGLSAGFGRVKMNVIGFNSEIASLMAVPHGAFDFTTETTRPATPVQTLVRASGSMDFATKGARAAAVGGGSNAATSADIAAQTKSLGDRFDEALMNQARLTQQMQRQGGAR